MNTSATATATANVNRSEPFDAVTLIKRMEEAMKMLPQPKWTLITPDGRVFEGDQRTVARALFQNLDITSLFGEQIK